MAATFIDYYLEGLLVGVLGTFAIIVLFLFIFMKTRKKVGEQGKVIALETGIHRALGKTTMESARYLLFAGILFLLLYLWITPVMPYSGTVENKDCRVRGRTILATTYFIYVDGKKRIVDKDIYDRVQPGDVVIHRTASQYYHIGGRPRIAGQVAWNTAFWGGVLGMVFVALCIGARCHHLHCARVGRIHEGSA